MQDAAAHGQGPGDESRRGQCDCEGDDAPDAGCEAGTVGAGADQGHLHDVLTRSRHLVVRLVSPSGAVDTRVTGWL